MEIFLKTALKNVSLWCNVVSLVSCLLAQTLADWWLSLVSRSFRSWWNSNPPFVFNSLIFSLSHNVGRRHTHQISRRNGKTNATSKKCYFRDDAAVIFKGTSKNYYLLLKFDLKKTRSSWVEPGERINSEGTQDDEGKEIKFKRSALSCREMRFSAAVRMSLSAF